MVPGNPVERFGDREIVEEMERRGIHVQSLRLNPSDLTPESGGYRVSYVSGGRRVEHRTEDPTDLLHRLTGDALGRGERLDGLEVARPTLEDVYLELTAEQEAEL